MGEGQPSPSHQLEGLGARCKRGPSGFAYIQMHQIAFPAKYLGIDTLLICVRKVPVKHTYFYLHNVIVSYSCAIKIVGVVNGGVLIPTNPLPFDTPLRNRPIPTQRHLQSYQTATL